MWYLFWVSWLNYISGFNLRIEHLTSRFSFYWRTLLFIRNLSLLLNWKISIIIRYSLGIFKWTHKIRGFDIIWLHHFYTWSLNFLLRSIILNSKGSVWDCLSNIWPLYIYYNYIFRRFIFPIFNPQCLILFHFTVFNSHL